ncbi:MAG: phospholipase D-like domain-containing protein, partial [Myxococcota bacterium]
MSLRTSPNLVVLALLTATLVGPLTAGVRPAQADGIKLILNDPNPEKAPLDKCNREVCTSLVKLINTAKKTIDFAIYGMRNQTDVFEALERAKKRGVRIRGVIDRDADGKNYYSSTEDLVTMIGNIGSDLEAERKLIQEQHERDEMRKARFGADFKPRCERPEGFEGPLQCLGFSVGDRCLMAAHASREAISTAGAIMHNKYFVVDGKKVWMGSTNVSDSGTGGYNANLVVVVDNAKVAKMYTEEFEQMYIDGKYHDYKKGKGKRTVKIGRNITLDVLFSPQDKPITNGVRPLLQKAKKRIDVGIFFLTHKGIASDLMKAHARGVKVRVILDSTASKNGYTKHELLRAAGVPVKVETW